MDEGLWVDAGAFADACRRGLAGDGGALREAVSLYSGPVLQSLAGDWIAPYQMEYEELYAQAIETLGDRLIASGDAKELLVVARGAVVAAPLREEVHVALIRAYRRCGMEAEAVRQFQEFERMLDEELGETPSALVCGALEEPVEVVSLNKRSEAVSAWSVRSAEPAGGAVRLGSPYYVVRAADAVAESAITVGEAVVLVSGPRQVGKTSLVARLLAQARRHGIRTACSDFQTLNESDLADADRLAKCLAADLAGQLGLPLPTDSWSDWMGANLNLDRLVGRLLADADAQVVWAMDEVDRLFGRAHANDFFGLLRSWHNRRALEPDGPWSRLTLVLAHATEAHLFITDLSQSPFNVGQHTTLGDFELSEVADLNRRYGQPLDEGDVRRLFDVTRGQPYLTRRALDAVVMQGVKLADVEAHAADEGGLFGDHLRRLLAAVRQDPVTEREVIRLLQGAGELDRRAAERLRAGGLLSRDLRIRVPAYEAYLRSHLL